MDSRLLIRTHSASPSISTPSTGGANNFNVINFAANKGLSDWDRRLIYTMSAVYELPFGQGKHYLTSGPESGFWAAGSLTARLRRALPAAQFAAGSAHPRPDRQGRWTRALGLLTGDPL